MTARTGYWGLWASVLALIVSQWSLAEEPLRKFAFGSCATQRKPQPIWKAINATEPELFLFLGDNIYADTEDMEVMAQEYAKLAAIPEFAKLRQSCPILATWDDHDYGVNDGGADYPKRTESAKLFLDFFGVPEDSPRRKRGGVYDAVVVGPEGKRVQFILLDTRYFRSKMVRFVERPTYLGVPISGHYTANNDPESTVLGEEQWKWFEEQLRVPAEIRIIASSIQVISDRHGWEKWANFPHERQRLFDLLRKTKAQGVLILSGDRHHAELSRMDAGLGYPLHDLTASALNQSKGWENDLNPHRVGAMFLPNNFGLMTIDWQDDPVITQQILDEGGVVRITQTLKLSELTSRD
jgi:alkaline phosphatase D